MTYSIPPAVASARGRIAALSRDRSPDDPDLIDARRSLAMANIESYVARVVRDAPPLLPHQRDRIATLLGGGHE